MSDSGRFFVTIGNRTFCVEPIDNNVGKRKQWGDIDPATKTMSGGYGEKSRGAIHEDDSIITEENGFKNITMLPAGTSPMGYITQLLEDEKNKKT